MIPIDGQPHTFSGNQLDYQSTHGDAGIDKATSTMRASLAPGATDYSEACFGINWELDQGPYATTQLAQIPAKVRVTGSYLVSDQHETAQAYALIEAGGSSGVLTKICDSYINATDDDFHPFDIEAYTNKDGIPLTAANLASPIVVRADEDPKGSAQGLEISVGVKIDSIAVTLCPPPQQPTTTTLTVPPGAMVGQTIHITGTVTRTDGGLVAGGAGLLNAVKLLRKLPDQVYRVKWTMANLEANGTFDATDKMTEAGTVQYTALFIEPTGFSISPTKQVAVTTPPPAPTAAFTVDKDTIYAGDAVAFTDASTGTITSWAWDFGDGTTSNIQSPGTHVYTKGGYSKTYTAKLTVTGPGGTDTVSKTITVYPGRLAAKTALSVTWPTYTIKASFGSEINLNELRIHQFDIIGQLTVQDDKGNYVGIEDGEQVILEWSNDGGVTWVDSAKTRTHNGGLYGLTMTLEPPLTGAFRVHYKGKLNRYTDCCSTTGKPKFNVVLHHPRRLLP